MEEEDYPVLFNTAVPHRNFRYLSLLSLPVVTYRLLSLLSLPVVTYLDMSEQEDQDDFEEDAGAAYVDDSPPTAGSAASLSPPASLPFLSVPPSPPVSSLRPPFPSPCVFLRARGSPPPPARRLSTLTHTHTYTHTHTRTHTHTGYPP